MNSAHVVYLWEKCQELADELGVSVQTNGTTLSVRKGGNYLYVTDNISGLLGYLEGFTEAKGEKGTP